jgi:12-hydroxyjasmonoyl-L-amino acid 12-hydroxylase / fatty acid hydroxylase
VGSSVLGSSVLRGGGRGAAALLRVRYHRPGGGASPGAGAVVDTQDVFRRFAFDTVHKISFGLDPGCLEPEMPESRFTAASRLRAVCVRRRVAGGVEQGSIERINRRGREVRAEEDKIRSKCFLYNQWH